MTTALITGATAGLGHGFAKALAADGYDLVLVARNTDRLAEVAEELSSRYRVSVDSLPADLSDRAQVDAVADRLADPERPVGMLVNNAGFSVNQSFLRAPVADEQQMLDVLVVAPMRLSHAVLPGMVERGEGRLINVSSVAGWVASGTYSAAKAWVTTFTEGLAATLAGTGVTATAVCPGFVHTEFHQRAGLDMSGIPEFLWLNVEDVVDKALRDAAKGHVISVASLRYQALSLAAQYAPRPLVRRAR